MFLAFMYQYGRLKCLTCRCSPVMKILVKPNSWSISPTPNRETLPICKHIKLINVSRMIHLKFSRANFKHKALLTTFELHPRIICGISWDKSTKDLVIRCLDEEQAIMVRLNIFTHSIRPFNEEVLCLLVHGMQIIPIFRWLKDLLRLPYLDVLG